MQTSLNNFNVLKEDDENYHVGHPNGKTIIVKKSGLSDKAQLLIEKLKNGAQKFADGGKVQSSSTSNDGAQEMQKGFNSASNGIIGQALTKGVHALGFDEGGDVPDINSSPIQDTPESIAADAAAAAPPPVSIAPAAPAAPMTDGAIPVQDPISQKAGTMNAALNQEEAANTAIGQAKAGEGAQQAAAINQAEKQVAALPTAQDINNKFQAADQEFQKKLSAQKVDPDRYWNAKSTGSKIAAGIGMILSGAGSGVTGQPNLAAKYIEDSINKDIDAQKGEQGKTMNLWKMNRDALGNDLAANLATKNQYYTILQHKLQLATANAQTPIAKQQAALANAEIEKEKANNNFKLGLMKGGDVDPSVKVQFLVPPERQKEVFEEIKGAQIAKQISPKILEAFDNAANSKNAVDLVPGMHNAGQKDFMGLINTTVTGLEGTARQAAFDSIEKNMMPNAFDSKKTLETKRQLVKDYLTSHSAAPTAKGFGIDLNQYQSTAPISSAQTKTMNGVQYVKVPGGWKKQ